VDLVPAQRQAQAPTVVFFYILYKSRAHRDRVNAMVMKDPRLAKMMDPQALLFDGKRMTYGGFRELLAFG
jgi:uncharacterized protein YbaA (DUF1428 family)